MKYRNIDDEGLVPTISLHERTFVPSRGDIALLRPASVEVCLSSTIIGVLFLLNPDNSRPQRKRPHRRKDLKGYLQPHCLPRLGATK